MLTLTHGDKCKYTQVNKLQEVYKGQENEVSNS